MKTQIIAIGGGAMSKNSETFPIERYALEQTGKVRPNVCFLSPATDDSDRNILRFYEVFSHFTCERSHLSPLTAPSDIEFHIMSQDLIYVGGGPARNLLAFCYERQLDKILLNAYQQGIVLAGISSGALCWFEEGLSYYTSSEFKPIHGLGFLKGSFCAHNNSEPSRRLRTEELVGQGLMKEGFAVDDDAALHYIDNKLQHVISADPNGKAYEIIRTDDGVQQIEIKPDVLL